MTPTAAQDTSLPASTRGRNIIAVASGKGGVGKTWLAISLTHALAIRDYRTLLFDGDLGLANVDIQLGLMPKQDLGSVISGRFALSQAATRHMEAGFDIIAGRSGSGSLANVPASRLQILSDDLKSMAAGYDKVVIDLAAGVERTVRHLAELAGTCIVVTTDEPTSLTDAYALIKVLHMEKPDIQVRIVVNMANSRKEGERTYNTLLKACEGFLKMSPKFAGVVRRDTKVRETIRAQSPLYAKFPHCEAAQDVQAIVENLLLS